jgi:2',3'-cyclic-nucleotide 2'-phosphodiesterase (5'-nucleotidase family)
MFWYRIGDRNRVFFDAGLQRRTTLSMSFRILHYSDVENATDDPQRVGRLVGCLREHRDDATLVCGTGDITGPGLLSMETDGEHALPLFEMLKPDFSTVGNHDFDNGFDALQTLVEDSPQQWLLANVETQEGDRFGAAFGVRPTATTTVEASGEAHTVGLVGVTDPETLDGHWFASDLTVTDPVEAVRDELPNLGDCDITVVLSHAGTRDAEIARLDGVDLILGGHDHDRRAETVDGTPVVHPGERGERLSAVEFDGDTPSVTLHDVTESPVADDVTERYRELFADLGLDETLTHLETPVFRHRDDRYPESPIGNFVVDAFRWQTGADVAVAHPLMFRGGPPLVGDVSIGDVRATTPFGSELHTTTVDGENLRALLESFGTVEFLDNSEVFGHVSGVSLSWRRDEDGLELVDATVDGGPIDTSESYTVAAPSFEFSSDDVYPVLDWEDIEADYDHHHDALVEYAREYGIDSDTDGRMELVAETTEESVRSP